LTGRNLTPAGLARAKRPDVCLAGGGGLGLTGRMAETLVVNEIYLSLQGESTFAGLPCIFVRLTACNLRCSYCDTAYAFTEGARRPLGEVLTEVRRLAEPFSRHNPVGTLSAGFEERPQVAEIRSPKSEVQLPKSEIRNPKSELLEPRTPYPAPLSHTAFRIPSRLPLVELTGGEPLLQPAALPLMTALCDAGFTVLLETSGALDLTPVDPRVHRIMDLKCPSSGEAARNRWENLRHLTAGDEVKFVIGTVEDYEWARRVLAEHELARVCPVLFSSVIPLSPAQQHPALKPVPPGQTPLSRQALAEQIVADALPVRFQLQMHKFIWPADQRGV
jgi:7-carboxy-7-deazaguanine synthase